MKRTPVVKPNGNRDKHGNSLICGEWALVYSIHVDTAQDP